MALWDDDGPKSQGKIITAVLQDRGGDARDMLKGWSHADLLTLAAAAERLARMAKVAATWKEGQD
jgi:hypothetical protein